MTQSGNSRRIMIIFDDLSYRISRKEIQRVVNVVLKKEHYSDVAVNIVFTDVKTIRKLNREYFNDNRSTDVISFNFNDELLGEIYVCLPRARRQAEAFGIPIKTEIERLVIHGLLHLMGYDHESADDHGVMFGKQESYLKVIG